LYKARYTAGFCGFLKEVSGSLATGNFIKYVLLDTEKIFFGYTVRLNCFTDIPKADLENKLI